jgi:hypothetical protein
MMRVRVNVFGIVRVFIFVLILVTLQLSSSLYVELDMDKCQNMLELLSLSSQGSNFKSLHPVEYNLSLVSAHDRNLFELSSPDFFIYDSLEDAGHEFEASQQTSAFVRKNMLEQAEDSLVPSSAIITMVVEVDFSPVSTAPNSRLEGLIESSLKTLDVSALILHDSSESTVVVKECFWYGVVRSENKKIACAMILQHSQCLYIPNNIMLSSISYGQWMYKLVSIVSGLGNVVFEVDIGRSIQEKLFEHCNLDVDYSYIRGFKFHMCPNCGIIVKCFDKGAPCSSAKIVSTVESFWKVYAIAMQQSTQYTITTGVALRETAGEYLIYFNQTSVSIESRSNYTEKDKYFMDTIKRPCVSGLISHNVLVYESAYFYNSLCKPCLLNTYYAELPTSRTPDTENAAKNKTLFLGVQVLGRSKVYRFMENAHDVSPQFTYDDIKDLSVTVSCGTTVTVHLDKSLQFSAIRGNTAVTHFTSVNTVTQGIDLHIVIPIIYGEDPDNMDDPIFIDVRPLIATTIENQDYLAIFPIRHSLQQVCLPCPDHSIGIDYATHNVSACVPFEGARRITSQEGALETPSNSLLDTITGFQVTQLQLSNNGSDLILFLETNALAATALKNKIKKDAQNFFGLRVSDDSPVSFRVSAIEDVTNGQSPETSVLTRRRLLSSATATGTNSTESSNLVRVSFKIDRKSNTSGLDTWLLVSIVSAAASVVIVLIVVGMLAFNRCNGNKNNPRSAGTYSSLH